MLDFAQGRNHTRIYTGWYIVSYASWQLDMLSHCLQACIQCRIPCRIQARIHICITARVHYRILVRGVCGRHLSGEMAAGYSCYRELLRL